MPRDHDSTDDSGAATRIIRAKTKFRSDLATLWFLVVAVACATAYAVNLKATVEGNQRWLKQCLQQSSRRIDIIEKYLKFPGSGGTLPPDDGTDANP